MKKIFLVVLILLSVTFLTGCITDTAYSPSYGYYHGYNRNYVSSTGYGVNDYGLGFGTDYSSGYGLVGFGVAD